jgi:signal transduction histidine kinase/ligand-binding sensor domain-containing protein
VFVLKVVKLTGNQLRYICLLISMFCYPGLPGLNAQQPYSKFSYLTVNDGLSSNRIRCIYKDSENYLWMGTDVGLDKYDSYDVKKYRHSDNVSSTISSDILTCIYEDHNKSLWFGTYDGLNLYDPAHDNFVVYKNDRADTNSINSNSITGIVEDKKGNLWIVTDGSCLNKWDPVNKSFLRYPFEPQRHGLSVRPSRMAALDSKGFLWVGSLSPGITRFDPETGSFKKFDDPSVDFGNYSYKSLYIDKDDKIWIATDGKGFFSYDPSKNEFEHFGMNGDGKGTNLNFVLDVIPENDRFILLAVDQGGINRFDKVFKTFEYIMYVNTNDAGLNSNGIWCFHRDKEGILWIGTSGGGINYYNPKKERFKLFTHNSNNPKSLSYNFAVNFYEDHEGKIWVGTDGGGINVFDPETSEFKVFRHDPSDPNSISGDVIRGIAEDKDHNIWIGTWDAGLNRYNRKTGTFTHFLPDENNPLSISDKTIWNLFIDHNNLLWISIYNTGIDLFEINKGVIKRFRPDPDTPGSVSGNNSWFFYEDKQNKMWICTQNGLDLFDSLTNTFKVLHFPDNDIGSFFKDRSGKLWVGSNTKGLFMCEENGTILKTYDMNNLLPNNRIHAITQDDVGDIWISTNYGICRLNADNQSVRSYSVEDGLQGNQFYQQSFLKTREGELYFGGYSGFNSFFPDSIKDNDFIPPVYITDFQIFNKPVDYDDPSSSFRTHISEAKEITLKPDQSVFSFSFAAINYVHPKKNRYAYKMENFEKGWNYTDASRRYVTYTNLDPGVYTFKVKASNNDGVWNEKGVSLKITILPPWWKNWWFRIILISAAILLFAIIFLTRVRQLKTQKLLLEQTVVLKTAELNKLNAELNELNASKDKFFSIIAHDLKNPFSTIIGFSEMMKESIRLNDSATFYEYTVMINTSAVQTLKLLENLLEWANSQRGKLSFNPVPVNLNELVKDEFLMVDEMRMNKNIELKSFIDDTLTIIADKNMVRTILRNLITNGVKFTNRKGMVTVNAYASDSFTEIAITDNGVGMSKETIAKLFRIDANISTSGTDNEKGTGLGLFLCKEFIEKHGGKIWVESEEGKGSTFRFLLPSVLPKP